MKHLQRTFSHHMLILVMIAALVTGLSACNSSPEEGITGSGAPILVAAGPMSKPSGNLVVNGTAFDTSSVAVMVNGAPASLDVLVPGQLVQVSGEIGPDGRQLATDVVYDTTIRGLITDRKDGSRNQIPTQEVTVLGRTVAIVPESVVDSALGEGAFNASHPTLQIGQTIEVSGYDNSSGMIEARSVIASDQTTGILSGVIEQLNRVVGLMQLGGTDISFDPAILPVGVGNGDKIQIVTTLSDNDSPTLVAESIRKLLPLPTGQHASINGLLHTVEATEGPVDGTTSATMIVNGQSVSADSTTFCTECLLTSLATDLETTILGVINPEGVFEAETIEQIVPVTMRQEFIITDIAISSRRPVAVGSIFNQDGSALQTLASTVYVDLTNDAEPNFDLSNLRNGDHIIATWRTATDGSDTRFVATIERTLYQGNR